MKKTLAEMAEEVYEVNVGNGWYEDLRAFDDDVALLHTEVAEVFEAYRAWGYGDHLTLKVNPAELYPQEVEEILDRLRESAEAARDRDALMPVMISPESKMALSAAGISKPEGVGSELADILIRLLDTARRYSWDFEALVAHRRLDWPDAPFSTVTNYLHAEISRLTPYPFGDLCVPLSASRIMSGLNLAVRRAGIDLEWEYERKLAYNRTRGHRHGGKLL